MFMRVELGGTGISSNWRVRVSSVERGERGSHI
jgi:hypothetical protein